MVVLIVAVILFSGCVSSGGSNYPNNSMAQSAPQNGSIAVSPSPQNAITLGEVAKHSSAADCWMIIGSSVVDLSSYTSHPSGATYAAYCGKNATGAYNSIKGGRGHSGFADALVADYSIGKLAN